MLIDSLRERGPLTVAAFMELALYDPQNGYYARAAQRSGRAGDFFTSVDVGPLFGALLARQIAQMGELLAPAPFDLVEAGAGNGRLAADILHALRQHVPELYARTRLHLVETSATARAAQRETLDDLAGCLASSSDDLPDGFEGVLLANELFDAMPVHQVVMREDGLREVYVAAEPGGHVGTGGRLTTVEGPLSTPELSTYLERVGASLQPGWRAEINLNAVRWIGRAAQRLRRGFMILIDYGHHARELYSASHAGGTLTTFSRHMVGSPKSDQPWLDRPGEQDITAHVDFTSLQAAAEAEGLVTLGLLDQTYFLIGLVGSEGPAGRADSVGALASAGALKTLIMPGGLGSTMKVLLLGKNVGAPTLVGCSYSTRIT